MKNTLFKIVVPFYNTEKYILNCIKSIKKQNYTNYECILIDDISTDNSLQIAKNYINHDSKFKIVLNQEKKYALRNIYEGILSLNPKDEDVIVTLDGDDWFSSSDSLNILNEYYSNQDILMTYGSYKEYPSNLLGNFSKQIPQNVIDNKTFRESAWMTSHLRSFKYKLWKNIKKQDLLDEDGNFFKVTWDLAMMFPMLEMSGNKSKFIKEILYVYNIDNPLNDHKTNHSLQLYCENLIRKKNKYDLL